MSKAKESLKISLWSFLVFVVFVGIYFGISALKNAGWFLDMYISLSWKSTLAVIGFSPLLLSLFFLGRYFKESGKSERLYKILNTVSVTLLAISLFQMLLFLTGILG